MIGGGEGGGGGAIALMHPSVSIAVCYWVH